MTTCRILLIDVNRISLDTSRDMLEYPLGLLYLASSLKQSMAERTEVKIISYNDRVHDGSHVTAWINEYRPDILGLRSLTMGRDPLHRIARLAKDVCGVPLVIAGGPHATDSPADVMENDAFTCAVIGEGEQAILEIVSAYMDGKPFRDIPGIATRVDGQLHLSAPRPFESELDTLVFPDHESVDYREINKGHVDFSFRYNVPHANLFTSKGCPYKCIYCHHVFGKEFRAHSPKRMYDEFKLLHDRFGITSFQIIDDIFNIDRKRALKFFELIVRSNLKVTFSFPNGVRGDIMDEEMVEAMWAAGVRYMAYAVESGSPRIQRLIQKNLNLDRIHRAISRSTARGIVTRGFFMFGFPTETDQEVEMTIDFAESSDLVLAMFFTVLYFPGTPLYDLACRLTDMGRLDLGLKDDYVQVREGPYDFSRERLEELKLLAIRRFFFSDKRLRLFFDLMPNFYNQSDIDASMLVNIISGSMTREDLADSPWADRLRHHLAIANRFSEKNGFYV